MAVVIKPVLEILTPPEFHIAYRLARVEILTVVLMGASRHLIFGLAYAKDTATISKVRTTMAAFKIGLSWLFISTWGLFGAAFSAAVTGLISNIIMFHYSQKKYPLKLEYKALSIMALTAGGIFYWLANWDPSSTSAFGFIDGQFLPWIQGGLEQSFLGSWKDGKLIAVLSERRPLFADVLLKGTLAASFIVVLPIIHQPTRLKWAAAVRQRLS